MAQTSTKFRHVYGTRAEYNAASSSYANDVFVCTDTHELIVRGIVVGISTTDANNLRLLVENGITGITYSGGVLKWEGLAGQKGTATLLGSTAPKAAGTAAAGSSTQAARADHVHPLQTTVSGNAGSATKLATKRAIDGVNFDGTAAVLHYAACSTAAATAAKAVSISNFTLTTGAYVLVKFSATNTAAVASLTLNVSSTGAKSIKYRGANLPSAGTLAANRVYMFVYDGTYWQLVGDLDTNTTYAAATQSAAGLMSAADKKKLDGIASGATKVTVDSALSTTSTNPVQNKAVKAALDKKADLDSTGKVPASQLPSYVDDVVDLTRSKTGQSTNTDFSDLTEMKLYIDTDPNPPKVFFAADNTKYLWGTTTWYDTWPELAPADGKIYIDTTSNKTYRWSGSQVAEISPSIALGETASTAYPGNKGKDLATRLTQAEKDIDAVQSKNTTQDTNISSILTRLSAAEAQLCWFEA